MRSKEWPILPTSGTKDGERGREAERESRLPRRLELAEGEEEMQRQQSGRDSGASKRERRLRPREEGKAETRGHNDANKAFPAGMVSFSLPLSLIASRQPKMNPVRPETRLT